MVVWYNHKKKPKAKQKPEWLNRNEDITTNKQPANERGGNDVTNNSNNNNNDDDDDNNNERQQGRRAAGRRRVAAACRLCSAVNVAVASQRRDRDWIWVLVVFFLSHVHDSGGEQQIGTQEPSYCSPWEEVLLFPANPGRFEVPHQHGNNLKPH